MKQQIGFFESLTRLGSVEDVPIIILLNKTDILEQLITARPISDYFEDYTAGANCFQACQFFADKFAKSDHRAVRILRIYWSCAVEENSFRWIFKSLQNTPHRYNGTDPSNILGGEVSIDKPVAETSVNEMLRKHNEEKLSKEPYHRIVSKLRIISRFRLPLYLLYEAPR